MPDAPYAGRLVMLLLLAAPQSPPKRTKRDTHLPRLFAAVTEV